jgi:hypothetical protein
VQLTLHDGAPRVAAHPHLVSICVPSCHNRNVSRCNPSFHRTITCV